MDCTAPPTAPSTAARTVIVTGAGGRIGSMLRQIWQASPPPGLAPLWLGRSGAVDLRWDMLSEEAPDWPRDAVVLHLAGVIGGSKAQLGCNAAMIAPLLRACQSNGAAAVLFASTAAVYPPGPQPLRESDAPAPPNGYGAAKLAAEQALAAADLPVTRLRIGNVAGADALLSPRASGQVTLDPVPGRAGGPLRSWIGPLSLAGALACLCRQAVALPPVLHLVQSPALAMADLLQASGRDWRYGPENPQVVPSVVLDDSLLRVFCPLPPASPAALIAEIRQVQP